MIETDLYFGTSKPDGGHVTDTEWNDFIDNHISKVFSDGSTIIDANGYWRDPVTGKLTNEKSHEVICLYKKSKATSRKIDSLRIDYKNMFLQQSVLRVDKKANATF